MKKGSKKNKSGYAPVVGAVLDLHGYYAERAREEVLDFLNDAHGKGLSRVRIIVGKGNRSAGGRAVLPSAIKSLLNSEGYEYTYAKLQDGGEGALEVIV